MFRISLGQLHQRSMSALNNYDGAFLQKKLAVKKRKLFSQKTSTINVWQGHKYASVHKLIKK